MSINTICIYTQVLQKNFPSTDNSAHVESGGTVKNALTYKNEKQHYFTLEPEIWLDLGSGRVDCKIGLLDHIFEKSTQT